MDSDELDELEDFREAYKSLESVNDFFDFVRYAEAPDAYKTSFDAMKTYLTNFDKLMWGG